MKRYSFRVQLGHKAFEYVAEPYEDPNGEWVRATDAEERRDLETVLDIVYGRSPATSDES